MTMTSIFAILSIIITYSKSSSRYFVYTLTNPFDPTKNVPYPLDVCVNYDVSMVRFKVTYNYAKFTCNSNNDQITMIKYDSDAKCSSSSGTIDNTYGLDSFNKTGDLYSFNCVGEDNYAAINIFQGDDSCCGSSYTVSNMATNVCYINAENNTYSMTTCSANGNVSSYTYTSTDAYGCNPANRSDTADSSTYDNQCTLFTTFTIFLSPEKIYVRMNKCFQNGTIIDESTFCTTTTTSPTLPTNAPSNKPTNAPTTAMDAKLVGNISVMNTMIIGGVIVALLIVGIGMCFFIKKRKVQKQYRQNKVGLINAEQENNNQQPIAMDPVVRNESNDDQEIVGTADEIVIENVHPVLEHDQSHLALR